RLLVHDRRRHHWWPAGCAYLFALRYGGASGHHPLRTIGQPAWQSGCGLASRGRRDGNAPASGVLCVRRDSEGGDVTMRISARSQLTGTVKSVPEGAVTAEVVVTLDGGQEVVSVITVPSAQRLGLQPGARVTAVIKSTEVLLAVDD